MGFHQTKTKPVYLIHIKRVSTTYSHKIAFGATNLITKIKLILGSICSIRCKETIHIILCPRIKHITADVTMAWLIQQSLQRVAIPTFNGSALPWISFITNFCDIVHEQGYLTDEQRMFYLMDHLTCEGKMSVTGFAHNQSGYVTALNRSKIKNCSNLSHKNYLW